MVSQTITDKIILDTLKHSLYRIYIEFSVVNFKIRSYLESLLLRFL